MLLPNVWAITFVVVALILLSDRTVLGRPPVGPRDTAVSVVAVIGPAPVTGIIGALPMCPLFIVLGAAVLDRFRWLFHVF